MIQHKKEAYRVALAQSIAKDLEEYFQTCHTKTSRVGQDGLYRVVVREVERPLLQKALEVSHGNQSQAASILGMHRNTFRKKMVELGLE